MIDVHDYLPYRVVGYDSSYLYAINFSASGLCQLHRLTSASDAMPTLIKTWPTGKTVRSIWAHSARPGVLLAQVDGDIYKSVDYGSNWGNNAPSHNNMTYCMRLGNVGEPTFSSSMLQRALVFRDDDVYISEYNVNSVRTPGGLNDAVKILKSSDLGTTWELYAVWNTDGEHYTRHTHGIVSDGAYLYLMTGDTDSESGIIRWNPDDGPLASNQPLSAYSAFWGVQRYRTGDILFPPGDYMYWMADSTGASTERGIWKGRKDMTGIPVRVDSKITRHGENSGWHGTILPNGDMLFSEFIEAGGAGSPIWFYGSSDGGANWEICGQFGVMPDVKGGSDHFFTWKDGLAYYIKTEHSGKAPETATVVLKAKPYWSLEGRRIVSPVYWVAMDGVDADVNFQGYRPSAPWRSIGYALRESRVTHGARVIVGPGEYQQSKIYPDWMNNPAPSGWHLDVLIDGGFGGQTVIDSSETLKSLVASDQNMPAAYRNIRMKAPNTTISQNFVGGLIL